MKEITISKDNAEFIVEIVMNYVSQNENLIMQYETQQDFYDVIEEINNQLD